MAKHAQVEGTDEYLHAREVAARLQEKLGVAVYAEENGRWLEINVFDIERKLDEVD